MFSTLRLSSSATESCSLHALAICVPTSAILAIDSSIEIIKD
ncbi:Uncharacterised protein [Vibrio cholerae]|nr:Uncharacterised protein [Vibrio cholerae]